MSLGCPCGCDRLEPGTTAAAAAELRAQLVGLGRELYAIAEPIVARVARWLS